MEHRYKLQIYVVDWKYPNKNAISIALDTNPLCHGTNKFTLFSINRKFALFLQKV
jgi:hypothetical protein